MAKVGWLSQPSVATNSYSYRGGVLGTARPTLSAWPSAHSTAKRLASIIPGPFTV
ncbi:hypothetical protein N8546_00705 [bacterium]|nr:hypothetical protein [bacterium]